MKSVSRCIGLEFTFNPYILRYVLHYIAPFTHTLGKFAVKPTSNEVNNGLAYGWRDMAKKILQKKKAS